MSRMMFSLRSLVMIWVPEVCGMRCDGSSRGVSRSALLALCVALAACGASSIQGEGQGNPPPADAGVPGTVPTGGSCSTAVECAVGNVCPVSTHTCSTQVKCATHTECGSGAFCDSGTCNVNMRYGPCDVTANCVGSQTCESGHCGCGG